MDTQPPRVAIWCAVSSKPQAAEDKASLRDQERAGREYAEKRGGQVVAVYEVPGHSRDIWRWDTAERAMPAYRRLREDAETDAFDVLWALDADRLGRDPALSRQVVSLVVKSGGEFRANDTVVATVPVDQWLHVQIVCGLGSAANGIYDLTIKIPTAGTVTKLALPCGKKTFRNLEWLGFVSMANDTAVFFIDNISLDLEKN